MTKNDLIAVLGYGSQGKAIALNLRDSGYNIIVGLRRRSKSILRARREGLKTNGIRETAAAAGLIIVAIPDHVQEHVLSGGFFKRLGKNPPLVFLHGSTIHFGLVKPPPQIPVLLLAPHAPGLAVRENYVKKKPYSAFYAVGRGPKKKGHDLLIRLAQGTGIPRSHLIKTTFSDEAVGDLFGEQAVLCGGLARLLKYGFETLVEAGLPTQNAYLEVAYQLDLIVEMVKRHGLSGMFDRISPLAKYGSVINGPRVIPADVKTRMKKLSVEIESGKFIREAEKKNLKLNRNQIEKLTNRLFDRQAIRFSGK
jgi:ketol-acid reductoisomerase